MKYYVIDANVMLLAGTRIADVPDDQINCWRKCIDFIHEVCYLQAVIVVDDGWEILGEYRDIKTIQGYPNYSDNFFRYVMTDQSRHLCFIHLVKNGEYEFASYPDSEELRRFDPPDRKYIAVSYNHEEHPPIVEAADSKWWGD